MTILLMSWASIVQEGELVGEGESPLASMEEAA